LGKTLEVEVSQLEGIRSVAIVMNANSFEEATDIDYFITNVDSTKVTPQWVVETYSQRNWVEVFYREAKGWLGLKEYQVRAEKKLAETFYLGILCLYFYSLAQVNWGLKTTMGK
jgi:transposase